MSDSVSFAKLEGKIKKAHAVVLAGVFGLAVAAGQCISARDNVPVEDSRAHDESDIVQDPQSRRLEHRAPEFYPA